MTLHVKDATGTFREITDLQVRDAAGTLREITEGWVRDAGGTLRQFYARVQILVSGFLGTSSHTNASSVTVGFRFNNTGTYQLWQNGTPGGGVPWIDPQGVYENDYEVQCSYTGDTQIKSTSADGTTWYSMGSFVTFTRTATPGGFYNGTYSWTIRDKATQTTQSTGTVNVATEDGS